MTDNSICMWKALLNTIGDAIGGRGDRIGEVMTMDDGRRFEVFRQAVVGRKDGKRTASGALLIVRFRP